MNKDRKEVIRDKVKQTKAAAHERVVKDGTIQFRLDAANMDRLLKMADELKTGAGVLARMWVLERLSYQAAVAQSQSNVHSVREESVAYSTLAEPTISQPPWPGHSPIQAAPLNLITASMMEQALGIVKAQAAENNHIIEITERQSRELFDLRRIVEDQSRKLEQLKQNLK